MFATPWTIAHQAPLSMEFSRQEYWNGLPFPTPKDLPGPGMEPGSPALQADSLPSKPPGKPRRRRRRKKNIYIYVYMKSKLKQGLMLKLLYFGPPDVKS